MAINKIIRLCSVCDSPLNAKEIKEYLDHAMLLQTKVDWSNVVCECCSH